MELRSQGESEITLTVFPAMNDLREVAAMFFFKRRSRTVFLRSGHRQIRNAIIRLRS